MCWAVKKERQDHRGRQLLLPSPWALLCESRKKIDVRHYEIKEGTACHIFLDAKSYEELLSAILDWWSGIQEDAKTMEAITFTVDDNGVKSAMVHWNYLTPEMKEEVDRELSTPKPLPPLKPEAISGN